MSERLRVIRPLAGYLKFCKVHEESINQFFIKYKRGTERLQKITRSVDVFPNKCPTTGSIITANRQHSRSVRRFHQVDLPENIDLEITEFRLHTCICPCGCGKTCSAPVPAEYGNTAVGPRLKATMALPASRFHLSKTMIRELLIDLFGPDASFSTGCISEAETEIAAALSQPYKEAISHVRHADAAHVDESSWFLKHRLQWLWVAVTEALTVFHIDPNRSREAFERFLGNFEGMIISDRFSAYAKMAPEDRQLCWAHLLRDFRKMVDRHGGAEHIGAWALREIEAMFAVWRSYLEGELSEAQLRKEFVLIRARFARLLQLGQTTADSKAIAVCKNLSDLWPALWSFLQNPRLLQPTNNQAEQAIRQAVIARSLSLGSQSERGLRFTERMLTVVTTLRKQGRRVLTYLHTALHCFRLSLSFPSILPKPSG